MEYESVKWAKLIWYSQCIPRHSFILWIAIQCKLKTQDKYMRMEDYESQVCPFCKFQKDTHDHLFFECDYPNQIWCTLKEMSRLDGAPNNWAEIISYIQNRPINKSIWSVIQRLVLGAVVYYVWQERNMRLFQNKFRPVNELIKQIKKIIKIKLMGLQIRSSKQTLEAAEIWDLPSYKHVNGKSQCHGVPND